LGRAEVSSFLFWIVVLLVITIVISLKILREDERLVIYSAGTLFQNCRAGAGGHAPVYRPRDQDKFETKIFQDGEGGQSWSLMKGLRPLC
jgi:hypothetical protein